MQIEHVAEEQASGPEESLQRIAHQENERGRSLRLRIAIQLWDSVQRQYAAWRGQAWKLEVADADEARQVQQALEAFSDALAAVGPEQTREVLARVRAVHEEQNDHARETNTPII